MYATANIFTYCRFAALNVRAQDSTVTAAAGGTGGAP
jgi:hypothetical protein